jgi:type IV secretory pathway VirB10-like protein
MTRWNLGLVLALGGLLTACQSSAKNDAALQAEKQKNEELQKRVAELESHSQPTPEIIASPVAPVWETQLQAVPPAPAPRSPARTPARASAPARRESATPVHTAPSRPAEPPVASGSRNEPDRISTDSQPAERPAAGDTPQWRDEQVNRAEQVTIPAGTQLSLVLETPLSSETSHPGDRVEARVERAMSEDGRVLLPGGTVLKGKVIEARSSGRVKGRARLAVAFDQIVVRGRTQPLATTEIEATAADCHERDAAVIGGGAAAGAIIGAITGGGKGAGKGAIIGGVAGTGAVLATKGKEVELPAGSRWTVKVKDPVKF